LVSKVRLFSPEGATVNSQGCKPLVGRIAISLALEGRWAFQTPRACDAAGSIALPGLGLLDHELPGVLTPGYRPTPLRGCNPGTFDTNGCPPGLRCIVHGRPGGISASASRRRSCARSRTCHHHRPDAGSSPCCPSCSIARTAFSSH